MIGRIKASITIGNVLNLITLVVALGALAFSFQANRIAHEANRIMGEGNEIARDANRIAILISTNPDALNGSPTNVQIYKGFGSGPVTVFGCRYMGDHPNSEKYYIFSFMDGSVDFINTGKEAVSVSAVSLSDQELPNRDWLVTFRDENSAAQSLPILIPSGSYRTLRFNAIARSESSSAEDAGRLFSVWYPGGSNPAPHLRMAIRLEDGSTADWVGGFYPSSPGLDFERACQDLDRLVG